jgi:EmrB/QacA subfamily drug resistance transporter
MCLGLAMSMLDMTVVNVALPSIERDLHLSFSGLEWTIGAYTLAFAVLLITGGRLGDIFGRRRAFIAGATVFAVSSAVTGAAGSGALLIAGRAAQGVGAALMMPATLGIITNTFPPAERGRAIGTWAGASGLALAIGPLLGGALTQAISWRAVFFVNIPVAIAAVSVALLAAPESTDPRAGRKIDVPGFILLSGSLAALVVALIKANDWGWGSTVTVALLAASVVGLVLFVLVERRVSSAMLPLEFFRSRQFVGANIVGFTITFGLLATLLYDALYMQDVLGYSALEAGALFMPATVPVMLTGPFAGRWADRVGSRPPMAIGMLLVAISLGVQTQISSSTGYALLLAAFILIGLGVGLTLSPMSTAALNSVGRARAGVASGVVSTSRQVGGTFGIAVVGALLQSGTTLGNAFILPSALAVVGGLAALTLVTAGPPPRPQAGGGPPGPPPGGGGPPGSPGVGGPAGGPPAGATRGGR